MALIASLVGLGDAAKDAHAQIGSLTEALPDLVKVGEAIKENVTSPLDELLKLLGTFQGPALGFAQSFEKIARAVADGTLEINDARAAMAELMGMLERFAMADRRAGDPGKINEIIQALERFLALMSRKGRP